MRRSAASVVDPPRALWRIFDVADPRRKSAGTPAPGAVPICCALVLAAKEVPMKKLSAIILTAGAVLSAPAFAERVTHYSYAWDPATSSYVEKTTVYYDEPSSTVTYVEPSTVTYVEPPIIVTAPVN